MKTFLLNSLIFSLFVSFSASAQFDDYKYIVVPVKFQAFKEQNQYKTSTLIKYNLGKYGFNVIYNDNLPDDLRTNSCLAAYVNLIDNSSMFTTKTIIALNTCEGKEIFRSIEGKSKEKNYEAAYREALVEALATYERFDHNYSAEVQVADAPVEKETVTLNFKNDVKTVNSEEQTDTSSVMNETVLPEIEAKTDSISKSTAVAEIGGNTARKPEILYAQEIENGYQLVDTTPQLRYRLIKTSLDDIYLVEGQDIGSAMIYKKGGKWWLEYGGADGSELREINIKF